MRLTDAISPFLKLSASLELSQAAPNAEMRNATSASAAKARMEARTLELYRFVTWQPLRQHWTFRHTQRVSYYFLRTARKAVEIGRKRDLLYIFLRTKFLCFLVDDFHDVERKHDPDLHTPRLHQHDRLVSTEVVGCGNVAIFSFARINQSAPS